jgi:N4-(beta-N-acetylglucosaminyl)-L-asparaginase
LAAPLLSPEALSAGAAQTRPALGQALPVIISSANGANVPKRGVEPKGLSCLERAMQILKAGGDTLDAVIAGVNIVEDDPDDTSVGYGGLPNEDCEVELDSSVMHGPSRRAGAVASLKNIKNPSKVAKLVLERTSHMLIVGEGALKFALREGFNKEELLTDVSRKAWLAWRESLNPKDNWGPNWRKPAPTSNRKISQAPPAPEEIAFSEWMREILHHRPTGTINCLAVDANGDISGVTTTSGLAWKIPGRVGDSPLIGCGLYVDNEVGAAGSTGLGEENIYINGGHTVVEMMRQGKTPTAAALEACQRVANRYGNNLQELEEIDIIFYAVNKKGEYGAAALWNGNKNSRGELQRNKFAVHDGKSSKLLETAFLLERK